MVLLIPVEALTAHYAGKGGVAVSRRWSQGFCRHTLPLALQLSPDCLLINIKTRLFKL